MKKILLFGSSGMLGRYVFSVLRKQYEVICINRNDFNIFTDKWEKLSNLIGERLSNNDVIINCAGIIPQKHTTDNNLDLYIRVNTLFPHKISEIAKKHNCKFIHITTDCVFDGTKGSYTVDDKHSATNIYGVSKSLGEPDEATIIRTSIIGEELQGKKSLIEWIISSKNKTINGFTNHYWNGITCLTLANIIKTIIAENLFWNGVKHIFSPSTVTKYDLCNYINEIYGLNINIKPVEAEISKNLSLNGPTIFIIDSIYQQIREQKDYKILNYGEYNTLTECRFCGNKCLIDIIRFNDFPLSGCFFKEKEHMIHEKIYPLSLLYCNACNTGLVKEIVTSDHLFTNINQSGYFYFSSTIKSLVEHFSKLACLVTQLYPGKNKILEIGCNDGVFLNNFTKMSNKYKLIGIDPSQTINNITSDQIVKYNDYFNEHTTADILSTYGKQDIIVCCNCLAHIDNIRVIYENIKKLLDNDGVIIIEVHYFKNIIDNLNFDFIYHEHMSYYTISTFVNICKTNGLYLENIEFIETHGGSLRAFIKHQSTNNECYNKDLDKYIVNELEIKDKIYELFNNLSIWKSNLIREIDAIKSGESSCLVGYGASGRTNMIINYLSVKFDIILDDSQNKINSYMPYYHTKIVNSNEIYTNKNIKAIFILAWPYTKSIVKQHIKFIENGGIFYKILPSIQRIDKNNYLEFI